MQIKQAKEYFDLGVITAFHAVRDLKPGCWILSIAGRDDRQWTLETARGEVKIFSSLDTLAGEVEKIAGRLSSINFNV